MKKSGAMNVIMYGCHDPSQLPRKMLPVCDSQDLFLLHSLLVHFCQYVSTCHFALIIKERPNYPWDNFPENIYGILQKMCNIMITVISLDGLDKYKYMSNLCVTLAYLAICLIFVGYK